MTDLKKNLSLLIKENSLSIAELERQINLKRGAIGNILLGKSKNPRIDIVLKLSSFFDCSIHELIGINEINEFKRINTDIVDLQKAEDICRNLKELCQKEKIEINYNQFQYIQKELYKFNKNKKSIDHDFLEWLLSKEKKQ